MEGEINWMTIAISWILSTVTSIFIVFVVFHARRCCGKTRTEKHYKTIKGLTNKVDLAEWNSGKPLKTSSPRLHRISRQGETCHITDGEKNSKETNNKNMFDMHIASKHYPQKQIKGTDPTSSKTISPKEDNILRRSENKTLLIPSTKSLQIIPKRISTLSNTEPCIKSISIHSVNPGQPITLTIQTLASSPTEKRRRSFEKLKTRRTSAHAISAGNITETAKEDKNNKNRPIFKSNFPSAGQINVEQVTSARPPRPYKSSSSATGSIAKGLSTGHFELRSGSNSPPPILLPLTATSSCRRSTQASHCNSSMSKSLSSDTFPLRGLLSPNMPMLNQGDKIHNVLLPQAILCNSSC